MSSTNYMENLYTELMANWQQKPPNLANCRTVLEKLKIGLTKLQFLPTKDLVNCKESELKMARDILEIAVEYSVHIKDIPAFERYMSQLKCYYFDYCNYMPTSDKMYKLLGLNLLFLLSGNRLSEFHTELELLSANVIQTDECIQPILALEQYIMEGRYNKIFQAKSLAPCKTYDYFMDILLGTVRDEIGACIEKAYEQMSIQEAGKRLNLKTAEEVKAFGKKRNWHLGPNNVYNFAEQTVKPKEVVPSVELAEQAIFYARELEMIV